MGILLQRVVKGREWFAPGEFDECPSEEGIGELRVGREYRPMKVGADDATLYRSFCSVDAVVASSPPDACKRRGARAQGRPTAVVLKPDQLKAHLVEVAEGADGSDDPATPRRSRDVEQG